MRKYPTFLFGLVMAAFVLAACGSAAATPTPAPAAASDAVVAEGHITPNQNLNIFFAVRGRIAEIPVSEGQQVKKGDVLVRMGDKEQAQAALATANLNLVQAQQANDVFVRTANLSAADAFSAYQKAQITRAAAQIVWEAIDPNKVQDDIDTAKTDVQDKNKILTDAKDALQKYLDLKQDNATRRKAEDDVRKAQADYNTAVRKVEELQRSVDVPRTALDAAVASEAEAQRTYENTLNGALDPDKKAILEAQLNNAQAEVITTQNALSNYDLVAPFDGTVTDINVTVGELVGGEKYAIQIADNSSWYVETSDLTELEVVNVSQGQEVKVVPDALPDLALKGTVESISQSFKSQGGDILYTVKIKLNAGDPRLRWGMTVQSSFQPAAK